MHRSWRLVDAAILLLVFLLPMMILLGTAERSDRAPTVTFWLLLILPLLILPWLWRRADSNEGGQAQVTAARRVATSADASGEFAALVAPVVDVRRAYAEGGVPIVEGQLRGEPARAFTSLERLLSSRNITPLLEDRGRQGVRVVALPLAVDREMRRRSPITVNILLFLATVVT